MKREETATKSVKTEVVVKCKRRPYVAPALTIYGAVNCLTAGRAGSGNDRRSMVRRSDGALKQNITRIGTHPLGFGLYLFDYKPEFREAAGFGRQFGVMADEVELVMPQAVSMHSDGYKRVDYTLLGIVHPDQSVH